MDDSLNEMERAELAVWDYPVSDKYTKIKWTITETGYYESLEDAVNKTLQSVKKDEGHALIAQDYIVKYQTLKHCELRQVGQQFSRRPLAFAFPKGSEMVQPFSEIILRMLNTRKLEQLKDKWWKNNPYTKKCNHYVKRNDGIELENIGGIFIVLCVGVVMALITLLIEFGYFKKKNASTKIITVRHLNSPNQPVRRNK